ncbi:MAG: GNAT family N-acetyltransferase [Bacillota bacterium]
MALLRLFSADALRLEALFQTDPARYTIPYGMLKRRGLGWEGFDMFALTDTGGAFSGVLTLDADGRTSVYGGQPEHAVEVAEEAGRRQALRFIDAELPMAAALAAIRPPVSTEDLVIMVRRRVEPTPPPAVPATVRPAVLSDAPALAAHYSSSDIFNGLTQEMLMERLEAGVVFALAQLGDGTVASAALSNRFVPGVGRISAVYTRPCYEGRRLATAVVGFLSEQHDSAGLTSVLYRSLENPAAGRLYERLGFEEYVRVRKLRYTAGGGY